MPPAVEKVEHPKDIFAKTIFNFLGKEFENSQDGLQTYQTKTISVTSSA